MLCYSPNVSNDILLGYHSLTIRPKGGGKRIPIVTKSCWENLPHKYMLVTLGKIYDLKPEIWQPNERDHIKFLVEFEKLQKSMNEYEDESVKVEFPESLRKMANDIGVSDENIVKHAKNAAKEGIKMKGIDEKEYEYTSFYIDRGYYQKCFDEMNTEISTMIKKAKEQFTEYNVECVVMTGAYSHEEMVRQNAEKGWSKDVTVLIPENREAFALGGAFYIHKEQIH